MKYFVFTLICFSYLQLQVSIAQTVPEVPSIQYGDLKTGAQIKSHFIANPTTPFSCGYADHAWSAAIASDASWRSKFIVRHSSSALEIVVKKNDIQVFGAYRYKFRFLITLLGSSGSGTQEVDLVFSFDPDSLKQYDNMASVVFDNTHKIEAQLMNVKRLDTITGSYVLISGSNMASNFFIRTKVNVSVYEKPFWSNQIDYNVGLDTDSGIIAQFTSDNQLRIRLKERLEYQTFPSMYEIQWIHVDDFGLTNNSFLTKNAISYNFAEGSNTMYSLNANVTVPIMYDRGYVVYRVRRLRSDTTSFQSVYYSDWWGAPESATVEIAWNSKGAISVPSHMQSKINWKSQIAFFEDTKTKVVAEYYDGTLRKRQSVTKNSTDNQLISTETIYDYSGKAVINSLPTGIKTQELKLQEGLLEKNNNQLADRRYFDSIPGGSCLPQSLGTLSSTSGSSKYYSSNNDISMVNKDYLPDAQGFPYIQTVYLPGSGGLVAEQSAPGLNTAIGSGRTTKLNRGNVPQFVLTKFFGRDAGEAQNFVAHFTTDPNNQQTMTVQDGAGKVILSTLLKGPENEDLAFNNSTASGLSGTGDVVLVDLLPNRFSRIDPLKGSIVDEIQLYISEGGSKRFDYFITQAKVDADAGICQSFCLSCSYTLLIEIIDECGYLLTSHSKDFVANSSCTEKSGDMSFFAEPDRGVYTIRRTLIPTTDGFDESTADLKSELASRSCKVSENRFIRDEVEKLDLAECEMPSPCDALEEMLISQMMPGGTYGKYVRLIGTSQYHLLNLGSNVYENRAHLYECFMRDPGYYPMILSTGDTLHSWEEFVAPQNTPLLLRGITREIVRNLLPIHPDYCQLLNCRSTTDLAPQLVEFEQKLLSINTTVEFEEVFGTPFPISLAAWDTLKKRDNAFYSLPNVSMTNLLGVRFTNVSPAYSAYQTFFIFGLLSLDNYVPSRPPVRFFDFALVNHTSWSSGITRSKFETIINGELKDEFMLWVIEKYLSQRRQILKNIKVPFPMEACDKGCNGVNINMFGYIARRNENFNTDWMLESPFNVVNSNTDFSNFNTSQYQDTVTNRINAVRDSVCLLASSAVVQSLALCNHPNIDLVDLTNYLADKCNQNKIINRQDIIDYFSQSGISYSNSCNPFLSDLALWYGDGSISGQYSNSSFIIPELYKADFESLLSTFGNSRTSSPYLVKFPSVSGALDTFFVQERQSSFNSSDTMMIYVHNYASDGLAAIEFYTNSKKGFTWIFYENTGTNAINFNVPFQVINVSHDYEMYNRSLANKGLHRLGYYALVTLSQNGIQKTLRFWNDAIPVFGVPDIIKLRAGECVSCNVLESEFMQFRQNFEGTFHADDDLLLKAFVNFSKDNALHNYTPESLYKQLGECGVFLRNNIPNRDGILFIKIKNNKDLAWFESAFENFLTDLSIDQARRDAVELSFHHIHEKEWLIYKVDYLIYDTLVIKSLISFVNSWPESMGIFESQEDGLVLRIPSNHALLQQSSPLSGYISSNGFDYTDPDGSMFRYVSIPLSVGLESLKLIFDSLQTLGSTYYLSRDFIDIYTYLGITPVPVADSLFADALTNGVSYRQFAEQWYAHALGEINSLGESDLLAKLDPQQFKIALNYNFDVDYSYSACSDCRGALVVCEKIEDSTSYFLNSFLPVQGTVGLDLVLADQSGITFRYNGINYHCIKSNVERGMMHLLFQNPIEDKVFGIWIYLQNSLTEIPIHSMHIVSTNYASIGIGNGPTGLSKVSIRLNGLIETTAIFQFDWNVSRCFELPSLSYCPDRGSSGLDTAVCSRENYLNARRIGKFKYEQEFERIKNGLRLQYLAGCMSGGDDSLTVGYKNEMAAATLYYYDRIGNLVQTVPPEGVTELSNADAVKPINALVNVSNNHGLVTTYRYNSLNLPSFQNTPDGGTTRFWYDYQGRIWASRNSKQVIQEAFSYTFYDALGRIIETGEVKKSQLNADMSSISTYLKNDDSFLPYGLSDNFTNWVKNNFVRTDVVQTVYDIESLHLGQLRSQENLISRVSNIGYFTSVDSRNGNSASNKKYATYYSYDISGNVKWLAQEFVELSSVNQRHKFIDYDYDLISGNVKLVSYQAGATDQLYHRYEYDADNRLNLAQTSIDGIIWQDDAKYYYYLHGPLSRVKLGSQDVQGIDYAYTIQGWLKSMNGVQNLADIDMGKDGLSASASLVAHDAAAFSLRYFNGDYVGIGSQSQNLNVAQLPTDANLYNGNIAAMSVGTYYFGGLSKVYQYDYLNRLVSSKTFPIIQQTKHDGTADSKYSTTYTYDLNGNITTLERYGHLNPGSLMDELEYSYIRDTNGKLKNNRLEMVYDSAPSHAYSNDFVNNVPLVKFDYDAIGNLTKDMDGNTINWNPYGKVSSVSKGARVLNFGYSGSGERVHKEVINGPHLSQRKGEYYVKDASGNLMALYSERFEAANTSSNLQSINSNLDALDASNLKNLSAILVTNNEFNQALLQYMQEHGLGLSYLQQTEFKISDFFVWNPGLIPAVFGRKEIIQEVYKNELDAFIDALSCHPVDALTYILASGDYGQLAINEMCHNGSFADLLAMLYEYFPVGTCEDLGGYLGENAYQIAELTRIYGNNDPEVISQWFSLILDNSTIRDYLKDQEEFQHWASAAWQQCGNHQQFGDLVQNAWQNSFEVFVDAIGEQGINQTLILGNFGNLFDYMAAQQGAADMMNALVSSIPNVTVAEYLAWVRSALGESTYQNLLQSSPQALNFDRVISLEEQYLYGSKRLGVRRPGLEMARAAHNPSGYEVPVEPTPPAERFGNACLCTEPIPGDEEPYYPGVAFTARFYTHTLGMKEYEITNHLGNVLATVLDRKTGVKASPTATTYAWFKADVTTAQDYYPFGSLMPGRTYVAPTGAGYRFGFNGMQRDDEIKGIGNQLSTLYRIYDARLALWLSIDPEFAQFPEESPYIINQNNPIFNTDPNGDCPWCIGAAVSAALDAGIQLTEIALSDQKSLSDFKWGDVAIAAAAGAAGVGIAAKMDKVVKVASAANRISKPVLKVAANATADVAVSSGAQLAKTGEVDGKKVAIDVLAGATAGRVASDLAEGAAKSSRTGIVLEKQAQRAARVATGSTRPARQAAATTTAKKAENFVAARGAAAGTATSGIISDLAVRLTAPETR